MSFRNDLAGGVPGFSDAVTSYETAIGWGKPEQAVIIGGNLVSTAVDAGNTPTSILRRGLLLGKITATGKLKEYDPDGTNGSQVVFGVLLADYRITDLDGTARDLFTWVLVGGPVQAANLILLDAQARSQMRGRFMFDDDPANKAAYLPWQREIVLGTAGSNTYTLTSADNGALLVTGDATAAQTVVLPTRAAGLTFEFLNVVNQDLTINSAAGDDIVALNDAAADSLAFSTASQKIGAHVRLTCNAAATKWYVHNYGDQSITLTT